MVLYNRWNSDIFHSFALDLLRVKDSRLESGDSRLTPIASSAARGAYCLKIALGVASRWTLVASIFGPPGYPPPPDTLRTKTRVINPSITRVLFAFREKRLLDEIAGEV